MARAEKLGQDAEQKAVAAIGAYRKARNDLAKLVAPSTIVYALRQNARQAMADQREIASAGATTIEEVGKLCEQAAALYLSPENNLKGAYEAYQSAANSYTAAIDCLTAVESTLKVPALRTAAERAQKLADKYRPSAEQK